MIYIAFRPKTPADNSGITAAEQRTNSGDAFLIGGEAIIIIRFGNTSVLGTDAPTARSTLKTGT